MISHFKSNTAVARKKSNLLEPLNIEVTRLRNFIIKDFYISISYKFQFLFQLLQIVFSILSVYFVGKMLSDTPESVANYGGNYFKFALVGLALNSYLRVGLVTITNDIRQSMNLGTLEAVCVTPVNHLMLLLYSSVWQFIFETFRVICFFVVGIFIFKADFDGANLVGALLVMLIVIPIFMMLGIISSSLIILLKRGDPIYWIFSSLGSILAGMLFPVSVMPDWLQMISKCLPLTHALEAMRMLILAGKTLGQVKNSVIALFIFFVALLPLTYLINKVCIKLAKRTGAFSTH